jgi:hypothetical protein
MNKERTPSAVGALSLIQTLLVFFCVRPLIKAVSSGDYIAAHHNEIGVSILIPLFIFVSINFRVHHKKYDDYDRHWGNENFKTRSLKGIMVIIFLMSPLLLLWWLQYQPWF